ncbi:TrkA family potassium uptake protein [Brevibacterium sp. BRM-1]|uniref:potassium channel family protein n=1 Tax=Brevibacterium sp. BRM-1 TaxID=2999062 RepID=UPI00228012A8|nr:TrkA family potassium uptake protein [Brevibacterium sp. BRM-1]WAL41050.1 TrkA family potassium uptake protein [Brevibacterium sp. BRM-1]
MKVVIAGAGSVGRSVARELLGKGHEALLIDRSKDAIRRDRVPGAAWLLGDACELGGLEDADLARADVVVAATGDDKTNLVLSLLAKTEFGVPRTVARVNNPRNEWLFDANWGVDVAVSTPRLMTALVEEAVEVGGLVHLLSLERGRATLMEFTVHHTASVEDRRVGDITWPADSVLVAIVRSGRAFAPTADDLIVGADELFFLAAPEGEARLRTLLGAEESEAAPEADRRADDDGADDSSEGNGGEGADGAAEVPADLEEAGGDAERA